MKCRAEVKLSKVGRTMAARVVIEDNDADDCATSCERSAGGRCC